MNVGVLAEQKPNENRVSLTPTGVSALMAAGHALYIGSGAGAAARYGDEEYQAAGGNLVYDREEVFGRSDLC